MEDASYMLDVGTLFHSLLFAYQKTTKEILGSGSAIFVHPTLECLRRLDAKSGLGIMKGESLDDALNGFSKFLSKAKVVKDLRFQKVGPEKYLLCVDGCIWAKHIHRELNPKDVTCPHALIAMALFERHTGRKVKVAESKYLPEGTETVIEPLGDFEFQVVPAKTTITENK
jgi:hypothetical protein